MFSKENSTRARGVVQNPIGSKGFGFVRTGDTIDSFTRQEVLIDFGFTLAEFKAGAEVFFEYETLKGGRCKTMRILEIDTKLSPKVYVEKVVDQTNGLVIKKVVEIGREKYPLGYRVFTVDAGGTLKLRCIAATLGEGREIIGKVLEAPKPVNFGKKTNVPLSNKGPTGQKSGPAKSTKGQKAA